MYCLLTILFIYIGGYATLYQFSTPQILLTQSNTILAQTGRKIHFDNNIGRRLFPAPTIILHNVSLTQADGITPIFRAKTVQIRTSWASLFSHQKIIDKLILTELSGSIQRDPNHEWDIEDLFNLDSSNETKWSINHFILKNSQLNYTQNGFSTLLKNIELGIKKEGLNYTYQANFALDTSYTEQLSLQLKGIAQYQNTTLSLPETSIELSGRENSYTFSGSLKADIQLENHRFSAKNLNIHFHNHRLNTNINTVINQIDYQNDETHLHNINTILTSQDNQKNYHATITSSQLIWKNNELQGDDININLGTQQDNQKFDISFNGLGSWSLMNGLHLFNVKIVAIQSNIHNQPIFTSEWEGNVEYNQYTKWAIQAQGLFDRQPANLTISRNNHSIEGKIELSRLDLSNYLLQQASDSNFTYPTWLNPNLQLNLGIKLGTLKLPSLEISDLHTQLKASSNQIQLFPISAHLYDGIVNGKLSIQNTIPLSWTLQQNSKNIQIQQLMQDLFDTGRFVGKGNISLLLTSKGNNHQEWITNLSGSIKINVEKGQWLGINFRQLFKSIFNPTDINNTVQQISTNTLLNNFRLEGEIKQGISYHQFTTQIEEPHANIFSQGETNFVNKQIKEDIILQRDAHSASLPIRLSGTIEQPEISLNYQKITSGSKTTEDKQKAITDTIKQQWQWLSQ